ncbi:MAG: DUF1697 domain-containing protein [candidate division Zixibacteria bacterium]|nr:DUF1697 domain-containing protein [candidate division Zixibacteria bacterium]
MPTYIAFLRAINVGGHTVKMEKLKKLFEALGFSNVETFIASGNVIFESSSKNTQALEKKIEAHLKKSLGYEVATFIRSASELAEIAGYRPFPKSGIAKSHALYVGFLQAPVSADAKKKLLAAESKIDRFCFHGRELYWRLSARSIKETKFSGPLLEKTLGQPATLRNVTTVRKLAEKYPSS